MKIVQTDTQLIATQGGKMSVVAGIFFALIGIAFIIGVTTLSNSPNVKTSGSPAIAYVFGAIFVVIGVLMALFANNRTVTLNKGGDSTVVSHRVIGSKEVDQSFSTADVIGVSLTTGPGSNGSMMMGTNTSNRRMSTISLLMKDNAVIQVATSNGNPGFSINGISTNLIQKAPLSKEANTIATFLNVPIQEANLTNPIAAIESVVNNLRGSQTQPINSVAPTIPPVQPAAAPIAQPQTVNPVQPVITQPQIPLAPIQPPQEPVATPTTPPQL